MNYRALGSTGLQVSEIGFGAWAIGGTSEAAGTQWGWGQTPEADAILAIQRARELGVNFLDTADVYGNGRSEEILGKALGPDWKDVRSEEHTSELQSRGHLVCRLLLEKKKKKNTQNKNKKDNKSKDPHKENITI